MHGEGMCISSRERALSPMTGVISAFNNGTKGKIEIHMFLKNVESPPTYSVASVILH